VSKEIEKEGKQKRMGKKESIKVWLRDCEEVKATFQVEQNVITLVSIGM
jgi:hypothetical protein